MKIIIIIIITWLDATSRSRSCD